MIIYDIIARSYTIRQESVTDLNVWFSDLGKFNKFQSFFYQKLSGEYNVYMYAKKVMREQKKKTTKIEIDGNDLNVQKKGDLKNCCANKGRTNVW